MDETTLTILGRYNVTLSPAASAVIGAPVAIVFVAMIPFALVVEGVVRLVRAIVRIH
jgi:hypothetical protein